MGTQSHAQKRQFQVKGKVDKAESKPCILLYQVRSF